MKKIILMILILLCFTLSACGLKSSDVHINIINERLIDGAENLLYENHTINLPDSNVQLLYSAKHEDIIYYCGADHNNGYSVIYKHDTKLNTMDKLEFNIYERAIGIDIAPVGNIYVLVYEKSENSNEINYRIKEIDAVNNKTAYIDISEALKNDKTSVISFAASSDNDLYIVTYENIYLFDLKGKLIDKRENKSRKELIKTVDGTVLLCGMEPDGYVIEEFSDDLQSKAKYTLSSEYSLAFGGIAADTLYLTDGNIIYSINYKTGDKKYIANILVNNINYISFIPVSENTFYTIQNGVPAFWETRSEDQANQTTILRLATLNIDLNLQTAVSIFNYENSKCKIEVVDYSVYDTGGDKNAGLIKLNTDILAGNVPDIFDLASIPGDAYTSKGLLEDISTFINNDDTISYDKFTTSIMNTLTENGKIYELVPGFRIVAMAGSLTDESTWCPEDFIAAAQRSKNEGISPLPGYISREDFISFVLAFSGDSYVNKATKKCDFNNQEFAKLLEFSSGLLPRSELDEEEYMDLFINEYNNILDGKQLLSITDTGRPVSEILKYKRLYGPKAAFISFPTASGNGYAMTPFMRLGMSTYSENKDDIWAFYKYLLSDDFQNEICLSQYMPVMSHVLTRYINEDIAKYKQTPLKFAVLSPNGDNTILECDPPDSSIEKLIWDAIDRIDCINEFDGNVYDIILEESQAYYAGHKSISEVAANIQSRVSIYINE